MYWLLCVRAQIEFDNENIKIFLIKLYSEKQKHQLLKFRLKEIIPCVFLQLSSSKNKSPGFWIFPGSGVFELLKSILVGSDSFIQLIAIKSYVVNCL